jgi:hypothetical protein
MMRLVWVSPHTPIPLRTGARGELGVHCQVVPVEEVDVSGESRFGEGDDRVQDVAELFAMPRGASSGLPSVRSTFGNRGQR